MRRSTWRRFGSLILALAFLAGSGRTLFGLHECLHHGPGSVASLPAHHEDPEAPDSQVRDHHHHGSHDHSPGQEPAPATDGAGSPDRHAGPPSHSHDSHDHGPCTCLGTCVWAGASVLPSSGAERPEEPSAHPPRVVEDGEAPPAPPRDPWELPPATAPPLGFPAIAGG